MPLAAFPSRAVREALKQPSAWGADLLVLAFAGSVLGALVMFGQRVAAPMVDSFQVDLSLTALPEYTLYSLARGLAAYLLSLVFTLTYATYAAHHPRAERLMIPALDVLQSIPVLGFLPGLVMAMIALFPSRAIGLELASIVMIFTGQVWNMTFSFHDSLRSIPPSWREVALIQRLGRWQTFRVLELPAAMIGLVWNSMMSMAGGWFFLTVTEAFTLRHHDYRLPGIGSYMNAAIEQGDSAAMAAAVAAMTVMIVTVDQLLWRPLVVWSQRFKIEEVSGADAPRSWALELAARSRLWQAMRRTGERVARGDSRLAVRRAILGPRRLSPGAQRVLGWLGRGLAWLVLAAAGLVAVWGGWSLIRLVGALPLHDPATRQDWLHVVQALGASFLRTTTAVLLGAAWTLPCGILIGLSPRWSQRLQPPIQVLASFPAPMLFPLVTHVLDASGVPFTFGCVLLMTVGTQWYILFNTIAGASAIPGDLQEVARVYGLSPRERWTRLYLPGVFPYLVTGLVTAAGGAWNALIVSEMVETPDGTHLAFGLGSLISKATSDGNYPLLTASVATMTLAVVSINRVLWKRLYRLAQGRYRFQE